MTSKANLFYVLIIFTFLISAGCSDGARDDKSAPTTPQNIVVTSGISHFVVDWDPSAGATKYNLYLSTSTDSTATPTKLANVTSPYTLSGLTNGTQYYVAISAENEHGESALSLKVTGKPYNVSTSLGGSSFQWIGSPAYAKSGDIYITGFTDGNLDGNIKAGTSTNLYLIKYSANGIKQWSRLLGENSYNPTWAYSVAADKAGNAYVVGSTYCNLDGNIKTGAADYLIIKYDSNGVKQWTKLAGVLNGFTSAASIAIDEDDNLYITGSTDKNLDGEQLTGSTDLFVAKYDVNGTRIWTRLLGTNSFSGTYSTSIILDKFGNSYITGYTYGNLDGNILKGDSDLFLVKYDTLGNKQWTRTLGVDIYMTQGKGVALDSVGNVYVSGDTRGNLDGNLLSGIYDTFLIKYDGNGNKLWSKLIGVSSSMTINGGLAVDKSGNIFVSGASNGNLGGKSLTGRTDMYLIKLDSSGNKLWSLLKGVPGGKAGLGHPFVSSSGNIYVSGIADGAFNSLYYSLANNIVYLIGFDAITGSE